MLVIPSAGHLRAVARRASTVCKDQTVIGVFHTFLWLKEGLQMCLCVKNSTLPYLPVY